MKNVLKGRLVVIVIAILLASSFSNASKKAGQQLSQYKYYAFPAYTIPNFSPLLPTISLTLNVGTLIYTTGMDLTINQALTATTSFDICVSNSQYLCAAKVSIIFGIPTVVEVMPGNYFSV